MAGGKTDETRTEAVMGSRPVWSVDILEPLMWSPSIDVLAVNTRNIVRCYLSRLVTLTATSSSNGHLVTDLCPDWDLRPRCTPGHKLSGHTTGVVSLGTVSGIIKRDVLIWQSHVNEVCSS